MQEIFERLVAAGIQLLPAALPGHFAFERDGYVALVEKRGEGFGNVGAPGRLTEKGVAQLVWRGERAWFVAKGWEAEASAEEIAAVRAFGVALGMCLGQD
jgi:hypothetical protein